MPQPHVNVFHSQSDADQEKAGPTDGHLTRSVSSKQVCFWFDVALYPDPKSVSHARKGSKGSSVEISKLRNCQRAVVGRELPGPSQRPRLASFVAACGSGSEVPLDWSAGHWLAGVPSKESPETGGRELLSDFGTSGCQGKRRM